MNGIKGKVALVTGASRGIGAAIADALAEAGAIVAGTATSEAGAAEITRTLGPKGKGYVLEVTQSEDVTRVVGDVTRDLGPIAILVNNAGVTRDNLLLRMKEEEWDTVLDTNLKALYLTSKAVLRGMFKAKGGRIINIGSVVGALGNAGQTNYAASKAGVIGFTRSLAREVGSRNITVNCVAPGFIQTAMTDEFTEERLAGLQNQIPLGVLGTAADIAAAVLFLAGDGANYITGQTLEVNGGLLMA